LDQNKFISSNTNFKDQQNIPYLKTTFYQEGMELALIHRQIFLHKKKPPPFDAVSKEDDFRVNERCEEIKRLFF